MEDTPNKTPSEFELFLYENGYRMCAQLSSGQWIGVLPFMFTTGLVYGLSYDGLEGRYCYKTEAQAVEAFLKVALEDVETIGDGTDPEGPWIKHKRAGGDRSNPNYVKKGLL